HDIGVPPNSENTSDWDGTGAPQPILGNPAETFLLSEDRKSTRLNSSHGSNSYAVFCLKKKSITHTDSLDNRKQHDNRHQKDDDQSTAIEDRANRERRDGGINTKWHDADNNKAH